MHPCGQPWQIEQARSLGLPYVYLGYWIQESAKMAYKSNFRPLEGLSGGRWSPLDTSSREAPPSDDDAARGAEG